MTLFEILGGLLLAAAGVCLLILILGHVSGRAAMPRPLKPHFLRLGRTAPDAPCPCRRNRPYRTCCRPADIEKLEADVREFLWRRWAKRSYGGRRRIRTLHQRIADFPLPEISLPDWVAHPERHAFPISEDRLRAWTPLAARRGEPPQPVPEEGPADDIL